MFEFQVKCSVYTFKVSSTFTNIILARNVMNKSKCKLTTSIDRWNCTSSKKLNLAVIKDTIFFILLFINNYNSIIAVQFIVIVFFI